MYCAAEWLVGGSTLIKERLSVATLEDIIRIATPFEVQQPQFCVLPEPLEEPQCCLTCCESRISELEDLPQSGLSGLMAQRHESEDELRPVKCRVPSTLKQLARHI